MPSNWAAQWSSSWRACSTRAETQVRAPSSISRSRGQRRAPSMRHRRDCHDCRPRYRRAGRPRSRREAIPRCPGRNARAVPGRPRAVAAADPHNKHCGHNRRGARRRVDSHRGRAPDRGLGHSLGWNKVGGAVKLFWALTAAGASNAAAINAVPASLSVRNAIPLSSTHGDTSAMRGSMRDRR